MANRLTEGFDWFPAGQNSTVRQRLWGANNFFLTSTAYIPDVEAGRFGFGQGLTFNTTDNTQTQLGFVVPIGAVVATGFLGFALFIYPDQGNTVSSVFAFYDAVNNLPQIEVRFVANGVIKVYDGNGVLLASSVAGAYQENEWLHVEIKTTIASSTGACEVRVNTVPVIQLVSANTQKTAVAGFDSIGVYTNKPLALFAHYTVDDLFVNDTSGSTNNTWSGNLRVKTQFMTANGATDQFTIGGSAPAATNWQSVLNQILDDTKFVYDSNVGDIDLYTPDPNLNSPLVRVVQVRMALRQDDATQRVGRAVIRIGATNYIGSVDQYTNQTYTFYKDRWELNPATSVSFTGADVNGLQAGLKLQA